MRCIVTSTQGIVAIVFATVMHGMLSMVACADPPLVTLDPPTPVVLQTLRVTYDPAAPGAKLRPADDVYVIAGGDYADSGSFSDAYAVKRVDGRFVCDVPIRAPACRISISFNNRYGAYDLPEATTYLIVRRPDGQPVRHGYAVQMDDADPEDAKALLDKELALYPDNCYAYVRWWWRVKELDPDNYQSVLTSDLRRIESAATGTPADYQFARFCAYVDLHQEETGRKIFLAMLKEWPTSRFTRFASYRYAYHVYAENITGPGPEEAQKAVVAAILAHPGSPLAREDINHYMFDDEFPVNALRAIADRWIADEPANSLPYLAKAIAEKRAGHMQNSYDAVRRAISLTLTANLHLPESYEASRQQWYLPAMYRFWAATAQALNKPDEALAAAMASTQLYDGESWGRTEQLEGDIWASLDYVDRAEHAYTVARCRSADRGLDGLRKLYRTSHGSDDGLDVHLAELLENELQNTLAPAPKFELTTIDGKTFNTDSLRGKVVVLNFWFIGCGPCRRELPELNRIAAAFASRDDIAFFAPALDSKADLAAFLKDHEVRYPVVPDASALNERFEVRGHPTNIVIDRKGRIVWQAAGDVTFDLLKPMIDRALALGGRDKGKS